MFTSIYPVFHQKYPDVTVEPVEKSVHELQQMLADSSLDIAFLTLRQEDHTNDEYITLVTEEILLAVPAGHPVGIFAAPPGQPGALRREGFQLIGSAALDGGFVDHAHRFPA